VAVEPPRHGDRSMVGAETSSTRPSGTGRAPMLSRAGRYWPRITPPELRASGTKSRSYRRTSWSSRSTGPGTVVRQVAADYQAGLRRLGDEMTGSWLELALSMAQLKALLVIDRAPHATITVVSERLRVGASAASLTIDRLVRAGLAARSEDELDRRRVH